MTINVTSDHIMRAVRATIDCPVVLAARDAGLNAVMVGVGTEHMHSDTACARLYLSDGDESVIQPLPSHVIGILKVYDRTGVMEPFSFDIPIQP